MVATLIEIKNQEDYNFICFQKDQEALEIIIEILKILVNYEDPEEDYYREYVDNLTYEGGTCEIQDRLKSNNPPPKRKAQDLDDYCYTLELEEIRINMVFSSTRIFFIGYFKEREQIVPILEKCKFQK